MRNTRTAILVTLGLVTALAPAPAHATASAAGDPLRPYTRQKPRWQPCDDARSPAALRCATLKVPLDYTDPGGRSIDIAMSRLKASGPKERHGVLLLNPGGPGAPGLGLPADPVLNLPEEVRRRYDLIGFDPRGVGRSSPVSCGLTADEQRSDRPYRAETFAKDVEWARTVARKCRAGAGDTLRHLTTRNTARDMDVIRAVLGEGKISYLGYSYGTYLGAVYTQLFPRRADRFVLDSAADPARYGRGMFQAMAEGTEPAFTRWSEWTAARHTTYGLGRTPAEVRETFRELVARAGREPIRFDGALLTGDDLRADRARFFHAEKAAARVAGLKAAAGGGRHAPAGRTPDPAPPAPAPPASAHGVPPDNADASAWAVLCGDTTRTWPRDPERYRRDAIRDKARYPLYGDFASGIKPCAFWQEGSEAPARVDNTAGALIVQNEWDPRTPLAAGRGMHRALRGSRMVTVAGGEGHGVLFGTDSCADGSATAYLATGRLPAKDLTCGTRGGR
ncbi:hydrolase [Streptomyces eurocidicus]|uniref:Hydrolase n=1 Tax=Streptomyces eurocidicus TaxID=66423 RepID=A0A2N8NQT1_STREU|nr:alpha/beta fold hydrolase [Streptomyces eurocidicus]MBB5116881.1 pimeloyl-ACP methyl ester carboxylesterase [Streptomyces eurocidicus]MBF6052813.1 alpha/beta fold hydrolase [Streptomyces eurocidicus]PNE31125.1 hydrolase [Streptomyces eurocidicus]